MSRAPPSAFVSPVTPSIVSPAKSATGQAKKQRKRPQPKSTADGDGADIKPPPKKRQRKAPSQTPGAETRAGSAFPSRAGSLAPSLKTPSEAGGNRGRGGRFTGQGRYSRAGTAASVAQSKLSAYDDDTMYGSQDDDSSVHEAAEVEHEEEEDSEEEDPDEEQERGVNVDEKVVWDREDRIVEKELESRKRKEKALNDAADQDQLARLTAMKNTALNAKAIGRFVRSVLGYRKTSEDFARALGAVAKVHVGEIVEMALAIQAEWSDQPSPLTPAHLREAHRRYNLKLTGEMGQQPKLGMGLAGGGGPGPDLASVKRRGPFGGC